MKIGVGPRYSRTLKTGIGCEVNGKSSAMIGKREATAIDEARNRGMPVGATALRGERETPHVWKRRGVGNQREVAVA